MKGGIWGTGAISKLSQERRRYKSRAHSCSELKKCNHISNKKSTINSKTKLAGVAKHNLRKYHSPDYSRDNITLLYGITNRDYFEHVSKTEQDMAVEVIIQCGDKKFWEQNSGDRIFMKQVYKQLLLKLQDYVPDFKIANAVIHFDEASRTCRT